MRLSHDIYSISRDICFVTSTPSSQFVELKGSVFKKFEKSNLFQMSCSDVRERLHLTILLLIVALRNLAQFNWSLGQTLTFAWVLDWLIDCYVFLITLTTSDVSPWNYLLIKFAFVICIAMLPHHLMVWPCMWILSSMLLINIKSS